jgi:hypothetical protein
MFPQAFWWFTDLAVVRFVTRRRRREPVTFSQTLKLQTEAQEMGLLNSQDDLKRVL